MGVKDWLVQWTLGDPALCHHERPQRKTWKTHLPPRMPVTSRISTFLVGNPYKPLLSTGTLGRRSFPIMASFILWHIFYEVNLEIRQYLLHCSCRKWGEAVGVISLFQNLQGVLWIPGGAGAGFLPWRETPWIAAYNTNNSAVTTCSSRVLQRWDHPIVLKSPSIISLSPHRNHYEIHLPWSPPTQEKTTVPAHKNKRALFKRITWATKKKPSYFPLYWLVNRDPYSGLSTIIPI